MEARIEEELNDIVNQLESSTHLPSTDNTEMAVNRGNMNDFSEGQSSEKHKNYTKEINFIMMNLTMNPKGVWKLGSSVTCSWNHRLPYH